MLFTSQSKNTNISRVFPLANTKLCAKEGERSKVKKKKKKEKERGRKEERRAFR